MRIWAASIKTSRGSDSPYIPIAVTLHEKCSRYIPSLGTLAKNENNGKS